MAHTHISTFHVTFKLLYGASYVLRRMATLYVSCLIFGGVDMVFFYCSLCMKRKRNRLEAREESLCLHSLKQMECFEEGF